MHTGGRHKKCISKGNCMGGWLLPTLPGNSLLSHISSHNIMLKMMINIIMRMVWKLMGDLVIIKSLKPTNHLLSPRWWLGETDTSIASSIPRLKYKDQKRWNSSGVATFSLEIKMGKTTRETFCIPPYLLDRWKRERVNLCGAQGLETLILAAKSN